MTDRARRKGVVWAVIAASSAILFFTALSFLLMDGNHTERQGEALDYHIVFIADDMDDSLWREIYRETKKYGKQCGIYIENLKDVFSEDYLKADYLNMAVSMNVDGIFLQGDGSEETQNLVDEAEDAGIPVITVLDDCRESGRQSYISMGNYEIGREYGRQILKLNDRDIQKILLITGEVMDDTGSNMVFSGLRDILDEWEDGDAIKIEMLNAKNRTIFDIEERVRQKLIAEDGVPDLIICMGEKETISISRLVVDYNKVNTTKVFGYYTSENVLKAVENGSVLATLAVSAEDIAGACVDVFLEYIQKGHTDEHISIDVSTITKENVEEYRRHGEEGNAES